MQKVSFQKHGVVQGKVGKYFMLYVGFNLSPVGPSSSRLCLLLLYQVGERQFQTRLKPLKRAKRFLSSRHRTLGRL